MDTFRAGPTPPQFIHFHVHASVLTCPGLYVSTPSLGAFMSASVAGPGTAQFNCWEGQGNRAGRAGHRSELLSSRAGKQHRSELLSSRAGQCRAQMFSSATQVLPNPPAQSHQPGFPSKCPSANSFQPGPPPGQNFLPQCFNEASMHAGVAHCNHFIS